MPSRSATHWAALRSAAFFNSMFSKYLCCRVVLLPETRIGLYFFFMIVKFVMVLFISLRLKSMNSRQNSQSHTPCLLLSFCTSAHTACRFHIPFSVAWKRRWFPSYSFACQIGIGCPSKPFPDHHISCAGISNRLSIGQL